MKKLFVLLLVSLLSPPSFANESPLHDFKTDGCTFFPEGTPKNPGLWKHCCLEHDLRYWVGGETFDREVADFYLRICIEEVAGPKLASLMYHAIRQGHKSPVKHPFHWGWGWKNKRGMCPLTTEEKTIIREELHALRMGYDYTLEFIQKYGLE